jgi:hypothetical protein
MADILIKLYNQNLGHSVEGEKRKEKNNSYSKKLTKWWYAACKGTYAENKPRSKYNTRLNSAQNSSMYDKL